jgi:predicted nucleic acid-binding protein
MILVDTSVWVSHFRDRNAELESLLNRGQVLCHPFIIGEIACGHLKNRQEILTLLKHLPTVDCAEHDEVLLILESNKLMGIGLGWVDMHLAASAKLTGVRVWTLDKKFSEINRKLA